MANLTSPLSLILPTTIYRDYFSFPDTYIFRGRYAVVLEPYLIDPSSSTTASIPENAARLIYAVVQEVVPTAFLQWNQVTRRGGGCVDRPPPFGVKLRSKDGASRVPVK